jgi:hypothetical protein
VAVWKNSGNLFSKAYTKSIYVLLIHSDALLKTVRLFKSDSELRSGLSHIRDRVGNFLIGYLLVEGISCDMLGV